MRKIRIMASRQAWVLYRQGRVSHGYYKRLEGYECRKNGTDRYTPYWAA